MFSGIIKALGEVDSVVSDGSGLRLIIQSPISGDLQVDQSVAHDGVCLTVIETSRDTHTVQAVMETLSKTTLKHIQPGNRINLETSVTPTTLLDGHLVQGHVDTTLTCEKITDVNGSWMMRFHLPAAYQSLVIPQGSICINGISLTIARLDEDALEVAIIPYTYAHTNLQDLREGDEVNVEFDLIGKYIQRKLAL